MDRVGLEMPVTVNKHSRLTGYHLPFKSFKPTIVLIENDGEDHKVNK